MSFRYFRSYAVAKKLIFRIVCYSFHALGWFGGSWAWHGAFWLLSSTSRLLLTFPRKLIIVLEHPCKFTQFSDMLWKGKMAGCKQIIGSILQWRGVMACKEQTGTQSPFRQSHCFAHKNGLYELLYRSFHL